MRYGNPHNLHKANKNSDFVTKSEKGRDFFADTGVFPSQRPKLKEGYSYEGGEDMVAVGSVKDNNRRGGGRDGMHHELVDRMVYKKLEMPEAKDDDSKGKSEAKEEEPAKEPGPAEDLGNPNPGQMLSRETAKAKAMERSYEDAQRSGATSPFKTSFAAEESAQNFLDNYKLNLTEYLKPGYVRGDGTAKDQEERRRLIDS